MNNKYWEEDIETMSREKLQELQLQRLKKDRKSTRLNSSHPTTSRMPSSA